MHSLATGLCSTRLKAVMRSNKSGRLSRCTRLRNRRGRRSFPRTTLLGRWRTFQIPSINATPPLGRSGRNVAAGNTYGNVQAWVNAANTGIGVILGYQAATINVTPAIPAIRATQSAEPTDHCNTSGNQRSWAMALLRATSRRWARCEQTPKRGNQTFGRWRLRHTPTDPAQHTDMATLQRINQATLMQLQAQQDANQIAQAAALQQMVSQKQQQDALKAAFEDAAELSAAVPVLRRASHIGYRRTTMSQPH